MAYSQIDPASLQGDALTRWCQRSPQDIERERQAVYAQRYDDFVAGTQPTSQAPDPSHQSLDATTGEGAPGLLWVRTGPNSWRGQTSPSGSDTGQGAKVGGSGLAQLASAAGSAAPGFGDCLTCHGRVAPPLPVPIPIFPGGFPTQRDSRRRRGVAHPNAAFLSAICS
jgi:hypothetical protein